MPEKPDVSAAIAAALTEGPEGTGAKPEATAPAAKATPDSQEVSSPVKTETPQVSQEALDAFQARFGVDLSVLPDDETRAKFMAEATETNKTIGKLQREKAELVKAQAATPPPAPVQPASVEQPVDVSKLTDAQIAEALGINLENSSDPERDSREVALTRTLLEQAERMERLEKGVSATSTASTWEKTFDALEKDFGVLPEDTSRQDVYAWAAEQGIASPEAAYWAAVGPVRATVAQALSQQLVQLKTSGKKAATTTRPVGSADTEETRLDAKNVKDGIKEAFEKARAELGIVLTDA